jgi:toxin ParE1/3/4
VKTSRFTVAISERAEQDLRRIANYHAEHRSLDEAIALVGKVRAKIASLEEFPERGAIPVEIRALGIGDYRQTLIRPYRIFYLVNAATVTVVMIADGRRDLDSLLSERLIGG